MPAKLFFGYFALAMTVLSLIIVTRKNPVHSVLWMLALFFHIAAVYLFLNAEFLAAVQVILYAGAVLVLFLFVIMMLNIKIEVSADRAIGEWPIGLALVGSILIFALFAVGRLVQGPAGAATIEAVRAETDAKALGMTMYTNYLFPFEIASLILLIAIVGAMVLAKRRQE